MISFQQTLADFSQAKPKKLVSISMRYTYWQKYHICISKSILLNRSHSYTFNMIICLTLNSIRRIYYEYPFSVIRYKRNLFEYHEICLEGMWTDNKTMHRIIRMSWSWRPLRRSKWSLVSSNLFLYPLITVKIHGLNCKPQPTLMV